MPLVVLRGGLGGRLVLREGVSELFLPEGRMTNLEKLFVWNGEGVGRLPGPSLLMVSGRLLRDSECSTLAYCTSGLFDLSAHPPISELREDFR